MARYKVYITPDGEQYGFPKETDSNLYGNNLISFLTDNGYPSDKTTEAKFQVRILDTETQVQKVMNRL